jgi:ribonuclease BN (tRNA processing enzyme)
MSLPVSHTRESYGFRIRERETGLTAAYSGDTEECPALVDLGRDTDLFIMECSFPDKSAGPGHLFPEAALRVARQSRPGKLILTHFYPGWDPREVLSRGKKELPDTEVLMAEDGMVVDLR